MQLDTIICGDNIATMATFPDACIDLVVTSPPYDNLRTYGGHSWDFEGVAQQLWRIIKPGGVVVWVVADATIDGSETGTSFKQALRFKEIGFRLHDTMIYRKTSGGNCGSLLAYMPGFEYMFVFSNGRPSAINLLRDRKNVVAPRTRIEVMRRYADGRQKVEEVTRKEFGARWNVWDYDVGSAVSSEAIATSQPAVFPEALARDHILSWSNEGDVVLDPFAGSFTTCKMARLLGRRWIGIEINEAYCEIGRKRLSEPLLPFMRPGSDRD